MYCDVRGEVKPVTRWRNRHRVRHRYLRGGRIHLIVSDCVARIYSTVSKFKVADIRMTETIDIEQRLSLTGKRTKVRTNAI